MLITWIMFLITWMFHLFLISAQKERLLCEEEDSRDNRNVIYCGYCSTHHKKMVRMNNGCAGCTELGMFICW